MELFDFLNVLVQRPGEWTEVMPGDKRKWFFLAQRRFAIQHPMQANALQHLKINQAAAMDFWQRFMKKKYNGHTPNWMYTKGVAKAKETKEKKVDISDKIISEYAKMHKIDRKSVKDALTFYPVDMLAELKAFQKMIEQK